MTEQAGLKVLISLSLINNNIYMRYCNKNHIFHKRFPTLNQNYECIKSKILIDFFIKFHADNNTNAEGEWVWLIQN
jgi:hypothetical protein